MRNQCNSKWKHSKLKFWSRNHCNCIWKLTYWSFEAYINAIQYENAEPTTEDWADRRVSIWRCRKCQHQWFDVEGLSPTFTCILCPHCRRPMLRFSTPSSLPPVQFGLAKAPPVNHIPIPSIVGPDESSFPAPSIASSSDSGPPHWALPRIIIIIMIIRRRMRRINIMIEDDDTEAEEEEEEEEQ